MRSLPTQDRHTPVLLERVVDLLRPALAEPGATFVDGTLGLGGHTERVLTCCPHARAIGIDRDAQALDMAQERLAPFARRFTAVQAVFDELPEVLANVGVTRPQAILFDLGVSSVQLDEPERGFAYRVDAPLDMRMDQQHGLTAADVLNTYPRADIERILREYGEERFARKISHAVVHQRSEAPLVSSGQLVELLTTVIPQASQRSGGHPAKRTFQALRIEVNRELSAWSRALPDALQALPVAGRIAVLSYHSLEDRITKQGLASAASSSAPPGFPVELPEQKPWARLLTRGAERATADEVEANPRAASVRLRAAERTRETAPDSRRTP